MEKFKCICSNPECGNWCLTKILPESKEESQDELLNELIDIACKAFSDEAKVKLKDIYKQKFTITRKTK